MLIGDLIMATKERQDLMFECILSLLQAVKNIDHHQWATLPALGLLQIGRACAQLAWNFEENLHNNLKECSTQP